MYVLCLEQNCIRHYYEKRDEIGLLSKVLWEYWFGWDRAGSETNPDQSPRRDHQSVACIGGNPYTQEQRMFVTGNVPNVVILVCSILHTTNCGENIRVSNCWWWVVSNPGFTTMMVPHQSHPFDFGEDFCFWACPVHFFLATKDKKPQIRTSGQSSSPLSSE